jgi:hypothetical protein
MRNYDNLADYEFERLVAGLFSAAEQVRFERFTRGPDGGIDLRRIRDNGSADVIQVKHYKGSSFTDLKRAARHEAARLRSITPAPATYRFVTSQGLTPRRKHELATILSPYAQRDDAIFGRDDIEDLLDRFPEVEEANIKLVLSSSAALQGMLRSGTRARSQRLTADIQRRLPLWVEGQCFGDAQRMLFERHICVIAGPPGIGKTTLGYMLMAKAIHEGFQPVEVSADISEAWDMFNPDALQAFMYDDFLGHTTLLELAKNEDSRLVSFMAEVAASPRTMLVMTTREYILQRAVRASEAFQRVGLDLDRLLLTLESYSQLDRARIVHNHVWHSADLDASTREQIRRADGYGHIVEHRNFTPRLIEYITGSEIGPKMIVPEGTTWLDAALNALDHPDDIWRQAYANQISRRERALLLTLVTLPSAVHQDDLSLAFHSACQCAALELGPRAFETALDVLDDAFVQTYRRGDQALVRLLNPGLTDFLQRQLLDDATSARGIVRGARFFEQVTTMWQLVETDPRSALARELLCPAALEAFQRVYSAPTAVWVSEITDVLEKQRTGSAGPTQEWLRRRQVPDWEDERLRALVRMAHTLDVSVDFVEWVEDLLAARMPAWREPTYDPGARVAIARELAIGGRPRGPTGWILAIKTGLSKSDYLPSWKALYAFARVDPTWFAAKEWHKVRTTYRRWAEHEIDEYLDDQIGYNHRELLEIAALAERWEVGGTFARLNDALAKAEREAHRWSPNASLTSSRAKGAPASEMP